MDTILPGGLYSLGLPVTDAETITACEKDHAAAIKAGGSADESCYQLCWALSHSTERGHVERGLVLLKTLKKGTISKRDLLYLEAVSEARLGELNKARGILIDARAAATAAGPSAFQQGDALLKEIESALFNEGIAGGVLLAGGLAVIGGIVAGIVAIASSSRERR